MNDFTIQFKRFFCILKMSPTSQKYWNGSILSLVYMMTEKRFYCFQYLKNPQKGSTVFSISREQRKVLLFSVFQERKRKVLLFSVFQERKRKFLLFLVFRYCSQYLERGSRKSFTVSSISTLNGKTNTLNIRGLQGCNPPLSCLDLVIKVIVKDFQRSTIRGLVVSVLDSLAFRICIQIPM